VTREREVPRRLPAAPAIDRCKALGHDVSRGCPPGLREALAACQAGDSLVVTKLDRLARSLPDARAIADELTTRQVSLRDAGRS